MTGKSGTVSLWDETQEMDEQLKTLLAQDAQDGSMVVIKGGHGKPRDKWRFFSQENHLKTVDVPLPRFFFLITGVQT